MDFTKNLTSSYTSSYSRIDKTHKDVSTRLQDRCAHLLSLADIKINGGRPWDIKVHNNKLFARIFADGSLGLGEAYVEGWWDSETLDQFFFKVLSSGLDSKVRTWKNVFEALRARLINPQTISRAFHVGQHHYDIGNDLYMKMLDKRMIYSCGYWKDATNLDAAQEAKLDLICHKLELEPNMRILDIGCGWGGLARYAAENYGVEVVGITVSKEQAKFAHNYCKDLPVTIKLQDYRIVEGLFDRIVSVGMFEHVGYKNYQRFMQCQRKLLKTDGLVLLHTIGRNSSAISLDKWISRYIFPNSMLPSARQIATAAEGLFVIEDWHSFGTDYDKTLLHWYKNFERSWESLRGDKYDDRFYRLWKYYLLSCAGSFRARKNQLWQVVLAPYQRVKRYVAPR